MKRKGKVSKAVKKYVIKKIDALTEDKFYNAASSTGSGVSMGYNGTIQLLSNVAQGVTLNTRVGMVIKPKWLQLRLQSIAFSASANNVNPTRLRVIIFQLRQAAVSAGGPTPGNVLESVGSALFTISGYDDVTSSTNQYNILYDKTKDMDNGVGQQSYFDIKINARKLQHIHYVGANGTDINKGNIYMLVGSDVADAVSPAVAYSWQLCYEDA